MIRITYLLVLLTVFIIATYSTAASTNLVQQHTRELAVMKYSKGSRGSRGSESKVKNYRKKNSNSKVTSGKKKSTYRKKKSNKSTYGKRKSNKSTQGKRKSNKSTYGKKNSSKKESKGSQTAPGGENGGGSGGDQNTPDNKLDVDAATTNAPTGLAFVMCALYFLML